jgi:hypothetical protein
MAAVDPDVIRSLVASLEALIHQAERLPDATRAAAARAALNELRATLPKDVGGLAVGTWSDLSQDAQQPVRDKLETLQNELRIQVSQPGLRGSRMLMSDDPMPTWGILFLLLLALLGTAFVLPNSGSNSPRSPRRESPPTVKSNLCLHSLRSEDLLAPILC